MLTVEAWLFVVGHAADADLYLVTLLNWTACILTIKIGIAPKNF